MSPLVLSFSHGVARRSRARFLQTIRPLLQRQAEVASVFAELADVNRALTNLPTAVRSSSIGGLREMRKNLEHLRKHVDLIADRANERNRQPKKQRNTKHATG